MLWLSILALVGVMAFLTLWPFLRRERFPMQYRRSLEMQKAMAEAEARCLSEELQHLDQPVVEE